MTIYNDMITLSLNASPNVRRIRGGNCTIRICQISAYFCRRTYKIKFSHQIALSLRTPIEFRHSITAQARVSSARTIHIEPELLLAQLKKIYTAMRCTPTHISCIWGCTISGFRNEMPAPSHDFSHYGVLRIK